MNRVGIVVGMRSEARLAAPLCALPWVIGVETGGGTAAGGAAAARRLIGAGADGLISFGLAGGLAEAAPPGTALCADAVVVGAERLDVSRPLADRLRVAGLRGGDVLHSDHVVAAVAEKRALAAASSCIAVDMESGVVARAACEAGLPFAVLRAVCDPVGRALPAPVAQALDPSGGVAIWPLSAAVLRRPALLADLVALGRDASAARRALAQAVSRIARSRSP